MEMRIFVRTFFTTFNVDYHDKRELMNLELCWARKHHPKALKNWFNEFNCGRRSLKNELREDRPKTAVESENIDAVRELIMQYRHVTYSAIKASLVIYSTSIYSKLHQHT